jgi:hypothetical protein
MNVYAVFSDLISGMNVRSVARSNRVLVATALWDGRRKSDVL